jgi:hypothetical protein
MLPQLLVLPVVRRELHFKPYSKWQVSSGQTCSSCFTLMTYPRKGTADGNIYIANTMHVPGPSRGLLNYMIYRAGLSVTSRSPYTTAVTPQFAFYVLRYSSVHPCKSFRDQYLRWAPQIAFTFGYIIKAVTNSIPWCDISTGMVVYMSTPYVHQVRLLPTPIFPTTWLYSQKTPVGGRCSIHFVFPTIL